MDQIIYGHGWTYVLNQDFGKSRLNQDFGKTKIDESVWKKIRCTKIQDLVF